MIDLDHIILLLESATRMGAETDEPEGARYIQLSETLIDQMLSILKQHPDTSPQWRGQMSENRSDPVVDWLVARGDSVKCSWWQRGASFAASLLFLHSLVVSILQLLELVKEPHATVAFICSFILALLMAAMDGAMEKDK